MKKIIAIILTAVLLCMGVSLVACNKPQDITGVTLVDKSVYHDGQKHSLTVSGTLPQGAQVTYTYQKRGSDEAITNADGVSDVGVYDVTATVIAAGYNELNLAATLTIKEAVFDSNLSLTEVSVLSDGQKHKVDVVGDLPEGTTITYTYKDWFHEKDDIVTTEGLSEVGRYVVSATITKAGFPTVVISGGVLEIYQHTFTQQMELRELQVEYTSGGSFAPKLYLDGKASNISEVNCGFDHLAQAEVYFIDSDGEIIHSPTVSNYGVYKVVYIIAAVGYKGVTLTADFIVRLPTGP